MARQNGVPFSNDQFHLGGSMTHSTTKARASGPTQKTTLFVEDTGGGTTVGTRHNLGAWAFTGIRRNGVLPFSAGRDLIFERVWVEPTTVDAGFITEERTYSISIWNAFQEQSVEFTSMSSVDPTGTTLPTPTLPLDIRQSDDITLTLTVAEQGPPLQETYYKPLINGTLWSIYVTGVRALGLSPEPTWEKGIQISYKFETSMFQTEQFEEQRRPLMDEPYCTLAASFPINSRAAHKLFYDISYGHDKVWSVPVYNEKMSIDTITQGSTTITTSSAVDNLYYLNNYATHIAVIDHTNSLVEIKEISSITPSYTIEVSRSMVEDFTAGTTAIYPVFFGLLSGVTSGHLTDDVEIIELEFEEFNNG